LPIARLSAVEQHVVLSALDDMAHKPETIAAVPVLTGLPEAVQAGTASDATDFCALLALCQLTPFPAGTCQNGDAKRRLRGADMSAGEHKTVQAHRGRISLHVVTASGLAGMPRTQ